MQQALEDQQAHETATDHRHPVAGTQATVVEASNRTGYRLDDPVLIGQVRLWNLVDPRRWQIAQRREPAACDAIALFDALHRAADFGDIPDAFVAGWRH